MGGGRAAPRWAWEWAQKDRWAQRTGAHARPKPTSQYIVFMKIPTVLKLNSLCRIWSYRMTTIFWTLKILKVSNFPFSYVGKTYLRRKLLCYYFCFIYLIVTSQTEFIFVNICYPSKFQNETFVSTHMCISLASFHVQILCILLVSNLLFWYKTYVTFQYLQSLRDQTTLTNGKPHMALILLLRQAQVTYQFNFIHRRRNFCTLHISFDFKVVLFKGLYGWWRKKEMPIFPHSGTK